ncbi:MAG: DNA sulfur modification protein DndD [Lachnospiraceae bacterium]|nr:DNA sulfur modification protein DndD [Lachnospiraceae bacterium]
MIIKELVLHNFGVYASTNKFIFHGEKPIVLIGGMNGRGKTTFLEAVLLALYGSNSFAYSESRYKSFGQYLKSFVNVADGTFFTYVDLEFAMDSKGDEVYRVRREWDGNKKRTNEIIRVYKNHEYNSFLTDNWAMFIESILPSGLSNFFFFDGEKIAELAVDNTSNQMKESIKSLLGITVLDYLDSDLDRIINRTAKNRVDKEEVKTAEKLKMQKDAAITAFNCAELALAELEEKRTKVQQELESMRQNYAMKGGDLVTQQQELFQKRADISYKIEVAKEQLTLDAASELPLVLVKNLLRNIRENAEIEHDSKVLDIALKKMQKLSIEYENYNEVDAEAVSRFMGFVTGKTANRSKQFTYNLSDTSLFKLQVLLDGQLLEKKISVQERQKKLISLQAESDQIDNYLAVDIDEKAVVRIYRRIKELEQQLLDLDLQIAGKMNERRTCKGELVAATTTFNKYIESYLKKVELNDDSDRIIKYSHMAKTVLEQYKVRLQEKKVFVVAATMTACYKKLANKKNLIERIEMDPITLDLKYVKKDGEEINKSSLSAGEKQLMVISFLWALALCSKRKLPVIIDTPLSRLDSAHRVAIIQTYFPYASEQTIILSTDSEIDQSNYEIMKNNIGDEFTLIYDDSTGATTIREGYFPEVKG